MYTCHIRKFKFHSHGLSTHTRVTNLFISNGLHVRSTTMLTCTTYAGITLNTIGVHLDSTKVRVLKSVVSQWGPKPPQGPNVTSACRLVLIWSYMYIWSLPFRVILPSNITVLCIVHELFCTSSYARATSQTANCKSTKTHVIVFNNLNLLYCETTCATIACTGS